MRCSKLCGFGFVLFFLLFSAAASQDRGTEKLGKVQFPVSCSGEAQRQFDRAVALLHSFWFDAASKAFASVTQTDPSCAMGYWGMAMTLLGNPFAWPPPPKALAEGRAAVEKALSVPAKTPRERDYIEAIDAFYRDAAKVEHRSRALAYTSAMEQVYRRYPGDQEAAVFYALTLNATALPTDKTYANQLKAAEILEKVFAKQPNHPGVAHYLIHSYDYPPIAERGLPAARRYAGIAPSAPHALHMPSHIFTRRGFWQDSIQSNRASAAKNDFDRLHGMDYLAYAYLQGGQDLAAKGVVEEIGAISKVNIEHFVTGYALAAIPARYALERRRWHEAAALNLHPADFPWNRFPQSEAVNVFARGLGAARSGDLDAARQSIERLRVLQSALNEAKQGYWAEQAEIQRRVIEAWTTYAEGKGREALQFMRTAADLEDSTEKHPVTPGPLIPARELLGDMLLEMNEPAQALKEFESSMRVEPNRFRGLYGAAKAAELMGDRKKTRTYYQKLIALSAQAEVWRPELIEAKGLVAVK